MKYNAMEKQSNAEVAHAQVIYLSEVMRKTKEEISEITGYAISTVKNYIRKFADLLEWAKSIFDEVAEKVKTKRTKYDDKIINYTDYDIKAKNGELCYLFEFYDENDILLCSKVGTTTRTIRQRLIEELRSKTYKQMGATKAIINRVWECGNLPAEGLESLIRSEYIKKYPKSFKKNDRFINEYFDFDECDKIANQYLSLN